MRERCVARVSNGGRVGEKWEEKKMKERKMDRKKESNWSSGREEDKERREGRERRVRVRVDEDRG